MQPLPDLCYGSEADPFVNRLATGFVTSLFDCGYISAGAVSSADCGVSEVAVSDLFDDELDFSDDFLADLISPAWNLPSHSTADVPPSFDVATA